MKKSISLPRQYPGHEMERRARQFLVAIQERLRPADAEAIVAVNVETGEFALGKTSLEAVENFQKHWPDLLPFLIRADGGPVVKFHGK